ncbi:hypothetical protein ACHAWF_001405 [Thalassiosira exigua]
MLPWTTLTWICAAFLLPSPRLAGSSAAEKAEDEAVAFSDQHKLPATSEEFLSSHPCDVAERERALNVDDDGPFHRWVLAARHVASSPGWGVALPSSRHDDRSSVDAAEDRRGDELYARVFDLLNLARHRRLLPAPVDVASICHKGMEGPTATRAGNDGADGDRGVPPKPNEHIPANVWSSLWNDCSKQLSSTRSSSTCIDVPGLLVENPGPPWKINNPCSLEYRMVDGAHRLCLRKYLLALLKGEAIEIERILEEGPRDASPSNEGSMTRQIEHKRVLIDQTERGMYLVLDRAAFESTLTSAKPRESWARSKDHLAKEITADLRRDWREWMGDVMDEVSKSKRERWGDACAEDSRSPVGPEGEL